MGSIKLSVGVTNLTNHLLINFRERGNVTIVRTLDIFPIPATQFNLDEINFNDVVHDIEFRDSTDGISLGTLMNTFVYDVSSGTITSERRFYTGDGGGTYDPLGGDDHITDPYLVGKTVSGVFKEGFRFLKPGSEFSFATDTVQLDASQPVIQPGEVVSIEITYSAAASATSGGGFPIDVVDVTGDLTLDSTYYDKLITANSSAAVLSITLADLMTIPDKKRFGFNTHGGTQRYLAIKMPPSSVYYFQLGQDTKDTIWLGRGESIVLIKKGSAMHVIDGGDGYRTIGDHVFSDKLPLNGLSLSTGSWNAIADYPRLYHEYVNNLDPSLLGTGSNPTTPSGFNIRKWCIDAVNGYFWAPDLGGLFIRPTDLNGDIDTDRSVGNRKPGTEQASQVGQFTLPVPKGNSYTGGPNVDRFGNGAANPQSRDITFFALKETRPVNVNKNIYVTI